MFIDMTEINVWIALIGLVIMTLSLLLGIMHLRKTLKQSYESQLLLSKISKNQSKQIKILKKQLDRLEKGKPINEQLEKEKLELKKREQENKEKWKQVNTIFKTLKFLSEVDE